MMGRREKVGVLGRVAGVSLLATAAGIGCSALGVRQPPPLPAAVTGERRETDQRAGRLSYYVEGVGPPLLLIHSINAAASAYEVRPIFEHERTQRRVFAVDLPGFGFSDRSPRNYNPRLYVDAIYDMLDVIAANCGPQPVDALALSLSSEFLARAADRAAGELSHRGADHADRFRSGVRPARRARRRDAGGSRALRLLHLPAVEPSYFYDGLVSKPSIRFFLRKTWGSKDDRRGPRELRLPDHSPAGRQERALCLRLRPPLQHRHPGDLQQLTLPVWLAYGTRGDFGDFSGAGWTAGRANWMVEPYVTGALPFFEQPDAFLRSYDRFLAQGPRPADGYHSVSDARSPRP